MIITMPKDTAFEEKECLFCKKTYLTVVIQGQTVGFDKVEGVEDGYRHHECDEMMQALEQAFALLDAKEKTHGR